jgi:hypothetical protein
LDSYQLLQNKNILIITSFDNQKKESIQKFLVNERGVAIVDFYKISETKSMYDKIDLTKIGSSYDIVLVGAGIGASNILVQLEKLNTVCIDAGYVLERYLNPMMAKKRIFIV